MINCPHCDTPDRTPGLLCPECGYLLCATCTVSKVKPNARCRGCEAYATGWKNEPAPVRGEDTQPDARDMTPDTSGRLWEHGPDGVLRRSTRKGIGAHPKLQGRSPAGEWYLEVGPGQCAPYVVRHDPDGTPVMRAASGRDVPLRYYAGKAEEKPTPDEVPVSTSVTYWDPKGELHRIEYTADCVDVEPEPEPHHNYTDKAGDHHAVPESVVREIRAEVWREVVRVAGDGAEEAESCVQKCKAMGGEDAANILHGRWGALLDVKLWAQDKLESESDK